jgi:uncharacterized membrane protein YhaH (DUF805 family)
MKKCPFCSAPIPDKLTVCRFCGRSLAIPEDYAGPIEEPVKEKMTIRHLLFYTVGRIPRSIYWYYQFSIIGIALVYLILISALTVSTTSSMIPYAWNCFVVLALFAGIAISIKRIHDINWSGWAFLLFFVPIVNIIFWLFLGIAKGTSGPNKYGPDPTY